MAYLKSTIILFFIYKIALSTCDNLKTSCTVEKYEDLKNAAKICDVLTLKTLVIPVNTTMVIAAKTGAKIIFDGKITQVPAYFKGPLIRITGSNLDISGTTHHLLDGNGPKLWRGKAAPKERPRILELKIENSKIKDLKLKNSPGGGIVIHGKDLVLSNIHIDNKDGYPKVAGANFGVNTDGFGISGSSNITIKNSVVYNQDDCVVVNSGNNLKFDNIWCNGSHGLSLSVYDTDVSDITFKNCHLEKGSNGIHIKTHNDGLPGHIHNIVYSNITFNKVNGRGIFIQQNYPSGEVMGNIPITDLTFTDIVGTVASKNSHAVSILCAKGACSNWHFKNVKITGAKGKNECQNAPKGITC